ncbi:hypothetical protein D5H75_35245 [Bailinhaonella thermotolerans]|uniref:Uncharacterized protein n=1 Tax=Bailinhaonella thermotolerans TaxID=1070861 RepID=A0A3A4ASN7_9ACTN|nr:hypothetical protein D5H75_35245 [Bailinhaonella thermotolerans]
MPLIFTSPALSLVGEVIPEGPVIFQVTATELPTAAVTGASIVTFREAVGSAVPAEELHV